MAENRKKERCLNVVGDTVATHALFDEGSACLLMVSGGSDSTALAYIFAQLRDSGSIGNLAMLHVNHKLRGNEAEQDAFFVSRLAEHLQIPLFMCEIDIKAEAQRTGENIEALARRERYIAANEALSSMCRHTGTPLKDGRILTAHTSDDRIENFYMRSIVGTGPGGFRSMLYKNGSVCRPLLDLGRDDLRSYLDGLASEGLTIEDECGNLWREDATNAHTDRFRAYVRHNMVPVAKDWNPRMPANLIRSMNLIADEDDMVSQMAEDIMAENAVPLFAYDAAMEAKDENIADDGGCDPRSDEDYSQGFLLKPSFGDAYLPLQRRVVHRLLKAMLGADERVDLASVEAVLRAFSNSGEGSPRPIGGYTANIQGDIAVSANKRGVRVEPMIEYRKRRKKNK